MKADSYTGGTAMLNLVGVLQGLLSTNAKDEENYGSSLQFWLASRQRQCYCSVGSLLVVFALYKFLGGGS